MANHDWTTPKSTVTDEMVYGVAKVLISEIQASPTKTWTASIPKIQDAVGSTDSEDYGTYLQAVAMACKRYKIQWAKAGSNGRHYSMAPTDMASFLAMEAVESGDYTTMVRFTLTCPCCNAPTAYEVTVKPVPHA